MQIDIRRNFIKTLKANTFCGSSKLSGRLKRLSTLCAVLLISACQTLDKGASEVSTDTKPGSWLSESAYFAQRHSEVNSLNSWRVRAKVGVVTPQQRQQATLVWQFSDQANQVRLFGPLGVGAVTLDFDQNGAQLTDNKGVLHRDASAQALLTRIVGWPIPMRALSYWLFALPQPNVFYDYQLNDLGQLSELRQLDWQVSYQDYQNPLNNPKITLARKITATKKMPNGEQIIVKLISKAWRL